MLRVSLLSLVAVLAASSTSAHAQDRSGVRPEVLSLPTGPGSIEGLGESFSQESNTGAASYSVGIDVPDGVGEFAPSLALSYSSGTGNSECGLGWTIGLPTIQVSTLERLPLYDGTDRFVLMGMGSSGAQDIVQMQSGYYRFRVESAFARIERRADGTFEVRNRQGHRFRFGTAPSATVTDGSRIFAWLLTEQLDTHGNTIRYEWERDSTGRPYLLRIVYNDFSPQTRNEIAFDWEQRPDRIDSFLSTFRITLAQRLAGIRITHGGLRVRRYVLAYAEDDGMSRLERVQVVGDDDATASPPLSFSYAGSTANAMNVATIANGPARALGATTELDDVDGDALPDLVVMDPATDGGTYSYYPNLDGTSFGPRQLMSSTPSIWLTSGEVQLADMDGDGAADLVARVSSAIDGFRYFPAGNATFGPAVSLSPNVSIGLDDPTVRLVDLDHDRRTDWMRIDPTTGVVQVAFNLGNGQLSEIASRPAVDPNEVVSFSAGARLADCNGDGLSDIASVRSQSVRCWYSTGRGRYAPAMAIAGSPTLSGSELPNTELRDLSGDGLADLVYVGVSEVRIWLNLGGSAFAAPRIVAGVPSRTASTVVRIVDINGNGSDDIVWVDPTNGATPWRFLDVLADGSPGLLTQIDNGLGRVVSIQYGSIGDMRAWARSSSQPWADRSPVAQMVVQSVTTSDGIDSPQIETIHYASPYFDPKRREFSGFRFVQSAELGDSSQPTLVTSSTFDVGSAHEVTRGQPLQVVRAIEDGRILDMVSRAMTVDVIDVSIDGSSVEYVSSVSEVRNVLELSGTGPSIESRTETDQFGNVILEAAYGVVSGSDRSIGNDERIIRRTFAVNVDSWNVDNIATETIEDIDGKRLSERRYYYDGQDRVGLPLGQVGLGDRARSESWISGDSFETDEQFEYDEFGNVVVEVDARGSVRTVEFDPSSHTFPVRETQTVNATRALSWSAVYDERHDVITELTDPSGGTSTCRYDALGRVIEIRQPGDPVDRPTQKFTYAFGSPISYVRTESPVGDSGTTTAVSIAFVDGLGRARGTARKSTAGRWSYQGATRYGPRGLPSRLASTVFRNSADPILDLQGLVGVDILSDALGREIQRNLPDGSQTRFEYSPLSTREFDENDNDPSSPQFNTPRTRIRDGLGRIVRVDDLLDGSVTSVQLERDALGNIRAVVGPAGTRTFRFDGRSRRTAMEDATTGVSSFVYSNGGDLLEERDGAGNVARFEYDLVGRKTGEWHRVSGAPSESTFATLHYDEPAREHRELRHVLGQLAWVEDAAGRVYFDYDSNGRPTDAIRRFTDGTEYHTWTEFDQGGRPTRRGYPDRTFLSYEYDERGLVEAMGPIVPEIEWTAFEEVATMELGDGSRRTVEHDSRERVSTIREVLPSGSEHLNLEYVRDAGSRLRRIVDRRPGVPAERDGSASYTYDDLDRVLSESTARGDSTWSYNASGSLVRRTDGTGPSATALDYVYEPANARPFAPISVGNHSYSYDDAGRVVSDGTRTLEWDARGRLSRVVRGDVSETYTYDFLGRRIEKVTTDAGETSRVRYIDGDVEVRNGQLHRFAMLGRERIADMSDEREVNRSLWATVNFPMQPAPFAALAFLFVASLGRFSWLRRSRYGRPAIGLALGVLLSACHHAPAPLHGGDEIVEVPVGTRFLHSDAHGSVRVESDTAGSAVAEATYDVFGKRTSTVGSSSAHGTFQRNEVDEIGLSDFHTRPYDSSTGLFLAPDPFPQGVPEALAENPLDGNLYLYAAGRVPNVQDPSGLCGPLTPLCLAAAAAAETGVTISVGDLALAAGAATVATYGIHANRVNQWVRARGQRISRSLARRGTVRFVFATYTIALSDGSTYSGRTSTVRRNGESDRQAAERAVRDRGASHHRAAEAAPGEAGEPQLDRYAATTVRFNSPSTLSSDLGKLGTTYLLIRGREQNLINHYGGARSMANAAGQRGTSGNTINGIGLDNPILIPATTAAAVKWRDARSVPHFIPQRGWR